MTTLTPTKDTGGKTKPAPTLFVEQSQAMTNELLAVPFEGTGVNGAFVADLLSAALTHERCGTHLYRSVAGRTNNPVLKRRYEEFGGHTERHVELLEQSITELGGDPQYVSPIARAVQGMDTALLESTYRADGTMDVMVREMAMLDAVLLAETIDHANWSNMAQLVEDMPDGPVRETLRRAVEEVGPQEDEHLRWASDMKAKMTRLQASSPTMAKMGAKAEELMETVKGWFA
jgi:rubrerythrin